MAIPEKNIRFSTFEGGMDSDSSPETIANNSARYILNCRTFSIGNTGILTNVKGNVLIETPLPDGVNKTIGTVSSEEDNKFYFFVYNSNGYHTIFMYNGNNNAITIVLQSKTDSNGEDILRFSLDHLILHADIIDNNLLYWVDGYNKARKLNIAKCLDKSSAGYGLIILEDYITAYKKTAVYAPKGNYITDLTRNSNNLFGLQFKFAQWFIYDDGEISNSSDFSAVPLPVNPSNDISFSNNAIELKLDTGSELVKKIVVFVKIGSRDFVIAQVLDKEQESIPSNSQYIYKFYNDGSYVGADQLKLLRLYSYLPDRPLCQSFVKNAMTYSNFDEGFDKVIVQAEVAVTMQELYLPDSVENELNNPQLIITQTGVSGQGGVPIFTSGRVNTTFHFSIGSDVKIGNTFQVFGRNGQRDNYYFSYTATQSDTAATVGSRIKSWLRDISRGYPSNVNGGITNESLDGASWDYGYLGQWAESGTIFTGSVNPVSFQTLKDNGYSLQLIKYGGVRNYAFVYIDEDGRESLAYTSSDCVIRTPFVTETGDYKLPVHEITIYHKPPIWAKYWKLVRTPDISSFIWLLTQGVNTYTTDSTEEYLDLVVGSLPTYNVVHPNSILNYEFKKGDRLRLVKWYDEETQEGTFYPYFETEVLAYVTNELKVMDANIRSSIGVSSNQVTPSDGPNPDYIGKNILIDGNERTIVGISGADYVLNNPITLAQSETPTTYTSATYSIIDRRGLVRIKKPADIDIEKFSLIEIYQPQQDAVSIDYRNFNDFQQKYEVLNWGTDNAYHSANKQSQSASQPAILTTQNGDTYIRARELPTNNVFPGTQFLVDNITDPNYSDFYESDLHDLGKTYPQDSGQGRVHFGSRIRHSNNYIQDTSINGLNDFDNLAREDYNDPYGDIMRTLYMKSLLYVFKELRDSYVPIRFTMTTDTAGNTLEPETKKLLNDIQYFAWEGGVGSNPESVCTNGNWIYHASPNSGVFIRLGGEGAEPISVLYKYDLKSRELLSIAQKYGVRIYGSYDRLNDEVVFSIPDYIPYIYNSEFSNSDWETTDNLLPDGTTYAVLQQPSNGTVSYNGTSGLLEVEMDPDFIGNDYAIYQATLPDSTVLPSKKICITVVGNTNRTTTWTQKSGSEYCEITGGGDGYVYLEVNELSYGYLINGVIGTGLPTGIDVASVVPGESKVYGLEGTIELQTLDVEISVASPEPDMELLVYYSYNGATQHIPVYDTGTYEIPLLVAISDPDYLSIILTKAE